MEKVRFGLRARVTLYILILTTIIVASTGIYFINDTRKSLLESTKESAMREIRTLTFLSARSILAQDDIAIADTLHNMKTFPDFLYGRVYNAATQAEVPLNTMGDDLKDIKPLLEETAKEMTTGKPEDKSTFHAKLLNGNRSIYIFQKPIYHPFITENPPLLGFAQIALSNELIQEQTREKINRLVLVMLIFLAISAAGSMLQAEFIVKPIKVLTLGAQEIGKGNLDHNVPENRKDEIGLLAAQFNRMTKSLRDAQQEREEQLVVNEQIRQAAEIQEGMNPRRFLKNEYYQIKGFTRAAKGVGGDYYDFMTLPDGRLAVLISDVSGKSISASLIMVLIKTVVATYLKLFNFIRGDVILKTINEVMASQAHIDKFATILFFTYDPETRSVEFSNGGHGPLLVYRSEGQTMTVSKLEGLPMGIDEENTYHLSRVTLQSGDIIVLYTDGISEAWNHKKEEFSLKRLREKVISYSSLNAKEILEKIVSDIDAFTDGADQHDDMTMVILKVM